MNPISLVYDKMIEIALQNKVLQKYVSAGNVQRFDTQNFPKDSISDADLPEIALITQTITGNLIVSSSRSELQVLYTWINTMGSFDFSHLTAEITWGMLTASAAWCDELTKLQWMDLSFVKNAELQPAEYMLTSGEQNRGIQGWSFGWPLLVSMYFRTKDLRDYQWDPLAENME